MHDEQCTQEPRATDAVMDLEEDVATMYRCSRMCEMRTIIWITLIMFRLLVYATPVSFDDTLIFFSYLMI